MRVPYQANRTLGVLSKKLNLAEEWGLRPDGSNPCRHVNKYKENKRERFLTGDEISTLGQMLDQVEADGTENPAAVACTPGGQGSPGIMPTVRHADYISSWLDVLRDDNRAIIRAAFQRQQGNGFPARLPARFRPHRPSLNPIGISPSILPGRPHVIAISSSGLHPSGTARSKCAKNENRERSWPENG